MNYLVKHYSQYTYITHTLELEFVHRMMVSYYPGKVQVIHGGDNNGDM